MLIASFGTFEEQEVGLMFKNISKEYNLFFIN